jgi:hypothetical protein
MARRQQPEQTGMETCAPHRRARTRRSGLATRIFRQVMKVVLARRAAQRTLQDARNEANTARGAAIAATTQAVIVARSASDTSKLA